jgi:hypothetical protein
MSNEPKNIPIRELRAEDGAEELLSSPAMEAYMQLALAEVQGHDLQPALKEIAALPLEQRYTWRVASALKWDFADFDSINVAADKATLSTEDGQRLKELLKTRPIQFCLFLATLYGPEQMQAIMQAALEQAAQIARQ